MNTTLSKSDITQVLLKEYLDYSPTTGELIWIKKPSKRANLRSRAGSLIPKTGYRSITLFGKSYPEHHVVWLWYHGYWSAQQLDHIDHNRSNNAISNLREVTIQENAMNRTRRKNTRTDEAGIWFNRRSQRYVAEITRQGKKVYQASFIDVEDAIIQRKLKLVELGFHENHGSK